MRQYLYYYDIVYHYDDACTQAVNATLVDEINCNIECPEGQEVDLVSCSCDNSEEIVIVDDGADEGDIDDGPGDEDDPSDLGDGNADGDEGNREKRGLYGYRRRRGHGHRRGGKSRSRSNGSNGSRSGSKSSGRGYYNNYYPKKYGGYDRSDSSNGRGYGGYDRSDSSNGGRRGGGYYYGKYNPYYNYYPKGRRGSKSGSS